MINIKNGRSWVLLRHYSSKALVAGAKTFGLLAICFSAEAADLPQITSFQPSIAESTDAAGFVHPGVGVTKSILENLRTQIVNQQEPWFSYYQSMLDSGSASRTVISSNASASAPTTPQSVAFNSQSFNSRFIADGLKVYTQALLFYITGDDVYRSNAMNILRVWEQMDPAQYAYFSDAHIHTGIPMNRMMIGAEILRYTSSENSASAWTAQDTDALTNNLIVPATDTFMHRNNEFMNQHNYPLMGAMAGYIFTGNLPRYSEAVEWMTVNRTALNQGFNGSIKRLFRLVDHNAKTGEVLATPVVQHVEMGRDQAHGGGDLNNATLIAHMFYAQNTKVDPVTGEMSSAADAVGMYEFLDDRVLHAADFFWRYMAGNDTPWVPTEFSIFADGTVGGIYNFLSGQYRGRMLTTNFWDLYYYYTYKRGVDLSVAAPYFYQGFKKRVPGKFYYGRGLANAWDNVDGGGDFWVYIPAEAAQEGSSNLPKPQLNASLIEPEERYTAFDSNSQTLHEADADFIRLTATPADTNICLINFSYGGRSAVMPYGIRVRTNGVATLSLSGGLGAAPYVQLQLPNTQGEWRYVVYDVGTTAVPSGVAEGLNYVAVTGDGTQVDIDNFNVYAGTELSAPAFNEGAANQIIYSYPGDAISLNFAATDPNAADAVQYQLESQPAGAEFDLQTGAFSWTPSAAGDYVMVVTASDGVSSTSKRVEIRVGADRASALASINAGFDSSAIYAAESLAAYQAAYSAAQAAIDTASNAVFDTLVSQFQASVAQLQLLTPRLPDGSFDYTHAIVSSTFGSGIFTLVDSNPDTFGGFTRGKNSFHILDFGIDHKVSASAIGIQARMNFADRGAGITVFASNDSQNWVRITPDETPFQDDISILPVDSAYQQQKFRYFKLQLINPQPEALRGEVQNIFEISELHIFGERFETNNKIDSVAVDSSLVGAKGLVYAGSELTLSVTTKEVVENLTVKVQGVDAQVTSIDGIHWTVKVTLGSDVTMGALSYYVTYTIPATGQTNDAFVESGLYLSNGSDLINNISSLANLIDPSTSFGRPSESVTVQQVANLFDNDAGSISDFRLGGNGAGGYIEFDFKYGGSVSLSGVDILARQDGYYSRINGAQIQVSNDNVNWVTISSSAISSADWQSLSISNQQRFRYVRIYNGNSWFGNMAEVRFHGNYRGPVDLINSVTLSSGSADATGLVHTGEPISVNIGTSGAIADMSVAIKGVSASVTQVSENLWVATATLPHDTGPGYVDFAINYSSGSDETGATETKTTDGSRLYLIKGDDLLLNIPDLATLIDPSTSYGRPNASVTLANVNALFDGDAGTVSDFRIGGNGSGGYITFDFKEGNSYWITGVDMLARQDGYYTRINGAVVQGSNDNSSWTDLTSAAVSTKDWQSLAVTTTASYRYIRVYNWRSWFGNMAELRLHVDRKAPVTISNATADWTNIDSLIALSASDDSSGVAATYYAIGDQAASQGSELLVSEEGVNDLIYWSEDKAGNVEDVHYAQVKLDKTLPIFSLESNDQSISSGASVLDNQTLTLKVADALSGLSVQVVSLDGQLISSSAETGDYLIYLPGQVGVHQLQVYAKDLAGNVLSAQVDFNVETSIDSLISLFADSVNSGDITGKLADKLNRILKKIEQITAQNQSPTGMKNPRIIVQLLTNMAHELEKNASAVDADTLAILQNDINALIAFYQHRCTKA